MTPPRPATTVAEPVMLVPNCTAWRTRCETFALQISFLLGMQLMFGHEPPMYWRSTTAVRRPTRAICHASNFPPAPTSPAAHWRRGETMDDRRDYGRIGKRSPTNISDTSQRRSALSGSSAYDLTPSSASGASFTAATRQSSR